MVDKIWYNDLKDADRFYTKVMVIDIMALLDASRGGSHAVKMITLRTNMMQYYMQAEGIPQFIVMMEDAQKSETSGHAYSGHRTRDDDFSGGPCGLTFPKQG